MCSTKSKGFSESVQELLIMTLLNAVSRQFRRVHQGVLVEQPMALVLKAAVAVHCTLTTVRNRPKADGRHFFNLPAMVGWTQVNRLQPIRS